MYNKDGKDSRDSKGKKPENNRTRRASRNKSKFSLLEFSVAVAITGILVGMAFPILSNMRENAYNAKASQNHKDAEEAIKGYWSSIGQYKGYKDITATEMEVVEPRRPWAEARISQIEGMDLKDLPLEYFASNLILKSENIPSDELIVANISETGIVFYTRFKKADPIESSKLTFLQFKDEEDQHLQARAMGNSNSR